MNAEEWSVILKESTSNFMSTLSFEEICENWPIFMPRSIPSEGFPLELLQYANK